MRLSITVILVALRQGLGYQIVFYGQMNEPVHSDCSLAFEDFILFLREKVSIVMLRSDYEVIPPR